MQKKQAVVKLLITTLVVLAISAFFIHLQRTLGVEKINNLVQQAGIYGPIILIVLIVLTHILVPIQATPIVLFSFVAYGKWTVIYLYIASIISSCTNFWIARKFGRELVVKLAGKDGVSKIDHIATHEGYKALIAMRFFQGFITDFISYAAGLTSMDFKKYYIISILTPIPWAIATFIYFDQIPAEKMLPMAWLVGGVFFVIPPIFYYLKHRFTKTRIVHK